MFGKSRAQKMTRLTADATKGNTTIYVEPGMDLKAGDRIGLMATSMMFDAAEENHVVSYSSSTGRVVLRDTIKYYHYGNATSTAATHNGADLRGEVVLLTRNIRIVGKDVESWGCHFATRDSMEFDLATGEIVERYG